MICEPLPKWMLPVSPPETPTGFHILGEDELEARTAINDSAVESRWWSSGELMHNAQCT